MQRAYRIEAAHFRKWNLAFVTEGASALIQRSKTRRCRWSSTLSSVDPGLWKMRIGRAWVAETLQAFVSTPARVTTDGIEHLDVSALAGDSVGDFLTALERHNGIVTRNARLAAIHTFARFLATE
jgi:hypothetical protein